MLKSQINPHFFFNTLNNLYSLTLDNSNQASDVILKLSDLMRYTIYEGKKQQVPLEQEMACLDNYLSLQTIRLKRPVDISFTKEILDPQLQVPPLLFLTFVENAFKHGVNTFREGAFVDIILRSSATHLYFSVHNNYEASARPVGGGSGLENIRRRLKLLYPDGQHRLEIVDHDPGFNVQLEIQLK
ncbi:MAG: histidine kinase [Bacteroidota bacterium]